MQRRSLVLGLAFAWSAGVAHAEGPRADLISLAPGEAVSLGLDEARFFVAARGPATSLSALEQEASRQVEAGEHGPSSGANSASVMADRTVAPDLVVFDFFEAPEQGLTLLIVRNGLDRPLRYSAMLKFGDQSTPTNVCDAGPNHVVYESWPYRIGRIEISALRLLPPHPGRRPVCLMGDV
ncbi:MAG: hypothetical protein JNJ73_08495 [Hyphomonadaceae bacterium]|nr:hypothetical protein [Hyphomonadaceae bacterium]